MNQAKGEEPQRFIGRLGERGRRILVEAAFGGDGAPWSVAEAGVPGEVGSFVLVEADGDSAVSVVDVLARAGSADAAVYEIAVRRGLNPIFPSEVAGEVTRLVAEPGIDDPALRDRSDLPFVTIDEAHSRDLDQALFIERAGAGYRVFYALADAAFYVRPGTALFAEALRRGASYYLPGLVVPMLPRALSEGLVSLNPDVARRAMLMVLELDAEGRCTGTRIERARIRSRAKLTFDGVQRFLDDREGNPLDPEYAGSLELLGEVGVLRLRDALARDVVAYRRIELEVHIAGTPAGTFVARGDQRAEVERYNAQVSILCNVEGARLLARAGAGHPEVQAIYRVHPPPQRRMVRQLERTVRAIARAQGLGFRRWTWRARDGRPLAAFLEELPRGGPEGRIAQAIHRQAMVINVRSTFQSGPARHFGVGAPLYARFSSPMREIVGVFVHKEAWELLGESSAQGLPAEGEDALRDAVVESANHARELQKHITKEAHERVLDQVFREDLARPLNDRPRRSGTLMGLARKKAYVLLDDPPLDVKVYLEPLRQHRGQPLVVGRNGAALVHRWSRRIALRVGDAVTVRVLEHAPRRWILDLEAMGESDLPQGGASGPVVSSRR